MQTYYTIGEAAKMAGTTVQTVRYYSDIGLLQPVSIKESGYRLYSPKEIWQLNMITTLRSLDFSLTDIAKLQEGEVPVHQAIKWQLEAVRHQKILYEKMEQTLEKASHIEDPEESLAFMQKIVEVMKQSAETRKEYLMQKVREKLDEQIVPPD
ncbi:MULTISPECIES: MerR family transcriptional regulator [Bacillus]|nr:MerR family transcriptional regulator [Bacillus cereus]MDG1634497.1 MerR family transcriptional regulator [Bacillus cereus]